MAEENQSIFHNTLNWTWSKSCRGYKILGECNKIKNGIYTRVDSVGLNVQRIWGKGITCVVILIKTDGTFCLLSLTQTNRHKE